MHCAVRIPKKLWEPVYSCLPYSLVTHAPIALTDLFFLYELSIDSLEHWIRMTTTTSDKKVCSMGLNSLDWNHGAGEFNRKVIWVMRGCRQQLHWTLTVVSQFNPRIIMQLVKHFEIPMWHSGQYQTLKSVSLCIYQYYFWTATLYAINALRHVKVINIMSFE